MSPDPSFHVLSLPCPCSTEDAVLQVHTNGSFSTPCSSTSLVLTAGGFQLPQHSFQPSLQLMAHPYREVGTQHVLIPQHTSIILCADMEGQGRQHKAIWHTGQLIFPLFKKTSCRHTCGSGSKADLCHVSLLSDSNKLFWSRYHGVRSYITSSDQSTTSVIHKPSRPGCSIFVFISHSLMQVLPVTRMFI